MLVDHNKMLKAENEAQNKFIISSLRNIQLRLDPPTTNKEIKVTKKTNSKYLNFILFIRVIYHLK